MLKTIVNEGKTYEEATAKLLNDNPLKEEDYFIKSEETEAKLFKSKKIITTSILKKEIVDEIKEYLKKLSDLMSLDIKSEINEKDEIINVILISDNNPVLIGKDGRTLNSIQAILKQMIFTKTGFQVKINLDVSNYKARKLQNLEYDVKRIIKDVIRTHMEVVLDPMNSYERRYVHNLISKYPELESLSSGDGKERRITISFKETE
jgi:spoIIIJ-associated protein